MAADSSAQGGVIEINQAKAQAGAINGDLVADPAGFPVEITQPGSYRLTSNLSVDPNTTAIFVRADRVAIDLNGFAIQGQNSCSGVPLTCGSPGTGIGINRTATSSATSVRNGVVHGMGSHGILMGYESLATDVVVRHNGGTGLSTSGSSSVSRVVARHNGSGGISAYDGSLVTASIAEANGGIGISVNQSNVRECNSSRNDGTGIYASLGGTIHGNTLRYNRGAGIVVEMPSPLQPPARAMVTNNLVQGSDDHGIEVGVPTTVTGNHVIDSGGCGVAFVGGTAGLTGVLGGNSLLGNNAAGGCTGVGTQRQFQGYSMATECNVITCTTGTLMLGTFCPPNLISCLP